jgi:hypothetical protein
MVRRLARITAIAIGEGKSEAVFLRHIKALYLLRGCGITLKVKEGFGKGGKGVIDYALATPDLRDYDVRIAMLDTDKDWDAVQQRRADEAGITVVACAPCLEAVLLRMHGVTRTHDSRQHKDVFRRRFGGDAHEDRVYERHFARDFLDAAREHCVELRWLFVALGIPEDPQS